MSTTSTASAPPGLLGSYLRAVLPRRRRRHGGGGPAVPDRELVLRDVTADPRRVAGYARVCGFADGGGAGGGRLPATYPHVVAFPAALSLMTRRDFPFPVLGLVHQENLVEQHRPLDVGEPLTYRVAVEQPSSHPRGVYFPVVAEARDRGGAVVWRSVSGYLSRERAGDRAAGTRRPAQQSGPPPVPLAGTDHEPWQVPADIGRRYAAVSGDRNPIHLHPLLARPFGYRRPIAHGMWSAARCLAALTERGDVPEAFAFRVRFQRPVRLPARVVLHTDGQEFELRPATAGGERRGGNRDDRPHLRGSLTPLQRRQA